MATTDEFVMETFVTFDKVSYPPLILQFYEAQNCNLRSTDDRSLERKVFPSPKKATERKLQFDQSIYVGK